jgi:pimeloyl-ACP methyl ester carboxylesterase
VPLAPADDLELCYDTFGDPDDPTLLLIVGLGQQLIWWEEEFCLGFVDRGFHVVRYDNRDCGLSTKIDAPVDVLDVFGQLAAGGPVDVPYLLSDLAADSVALLDHLGVEQAHVAGMSMGGMIAQTLAIEHRERISSMTSIMSTTGDPDVGQPSPEALEALTANLATELDRETAVARSVAQSRITHGAVYFDEELVAARAGEAYDRCYSPDGSNRQLAAVVASGSRSDALRSVDVPALVIHGGLDALIDPSGGERTAEVIPGAELLVIDDMGHSVPTLLWPVFHESIARLAASTVGV